MNISKLFQRAHVLRMADKRADDEAAVSEFYVGRALRECIYGRKSIDGEALMPRETEVRLITSVFRRLAHKPEALRRVLLRHLSWPDDLTSIWDRLLATYDHKPRLLLAIADGMEA